MRSTHNLKKVFSNKPNKAAAIAKMNPPRPKYMCSGMIASRFCADIMGYKNEKNPPIHWNWNALKCQQQMGAFTWNSPEERRVWLRSSQPMSAESISSVSVDCSTRESHKRPTRQLTRETWWSQIWRHAIFSGYAFGHNAVPDKPGLLIKRCFLFHFQFASQIAIQYLQFPYKKIMPNVINRGCQLNWIGGFEDQLRPPKYPNTQ